MGLRKVGAGREKETMLHRRSCSTDSICFWLKPVSGRNVVCKTYHVQQIHITQLQISLGT
jgi:hypothetical protein